MKMMKIMVLTLTLGLLVIMSTCFMCPHVTANNGAYVMEDNNSDIFIEINETFNISLESNPSTGYEWLIQEYNYSVLELADSHYGSPEYPSPAPVGTGGWQNWTFRGLKDGKTTLTLVYWRPWEGNESIINVYTSNITVGTATTTSTPKEGLPCFEAVFAITGLLMVAYLLIRNDKNK
jgi:inhibitor of cysteine peptidase